MLIVSIGALLINFCMLRVAIKGIVIPIKNNLKEEQKRNDKAIDILNTIIRDKIKGINLTIKVLEIYKIEPLTEAELNKVESTEENPLKMNEAHEIKIKKFINNNIEPMANIINHLHRLRFTKKIEDLRNEHSDFLFSKFNMMKNEDIENLKEKINIIDEVLKDTRCICRVVSDYIGRNRNITKVEQYLKTQVEEGFENQIEFDLFLQAFRVLQEFEQYKEKLKKIDKEL